MQFYDNESDCGQLNLNVTLYFLVGAFLWHTDWANDAMHTFVVCACPSAKRAVTTPNEQANY